VLQQSHPQKATRAAVGENDGFHWGGVVKTFSRKSLKYQQIQLFTSFDEI
jgi:hypothetical protein